MLTATQSGSRRTFAMTISAVIDFSLELFLAVDVPDIPSNLSISAYGGNCPVDSLLVDSGDIVAECLALEIAREPHAVECCGRDFADYFHDRLPELQGSVPRTCWRRARLIGGEYTYPLKLCWGVIVSPGLATSHYSACCA